MNGIQLIKSDVKDFIDNRLRREEEFERAVCDIRRSRKRKHYGKQTAETLVKQNARVFNFIDHYDYENFKNNMKNDFQRVYDRIYTETEEVDAYIYGKLGIRMYNGVCHGIIEKLWTELWGIKDTILMKVSHRRFRYYKTWNERNDGFIKEPYKDILKEDEILQSIYDGTIFSHVEEVLHDDLSIEV